MPKALRTPERLFDRTWRPGHPFRPRLSGRRRWGMIAVFFLLCAIIGGYGFYTDSNRVRAMAERYLSETIGGRVEIGQATLSIFEGLRLDEVRVFAGEPGSPDAQVFSAATFLIEYSPRALLRGKVDANRIVAIDPRVTLTENLDTHQWNYHRLERPATSRPVVGGELLKLPEVVLRNAQVDYNQIRDGRLDRIGTISIEGLLTPDAAAGVYRFKFQSRGKSQNLGPSIDGTVAASGKLSAALHNVEFGPDIQVMLPAQVREFWRDHRFEGPGIKLADIKYDWKAPGRPFDVKIQLEGVRLTVQPEELLGREETQLRLRLSQSFRLLRDLRAADLTMLDAVVRPNQIAMENVRGNFAFTNDKISLENVLVNVAGNELEINGQIDGYSPDSAARIELASTRQLTIPADPAYIHSTPPAIREIYNNFRPQGTGAAWIRYVRPAAGESPIVTAEINIVDGQFTFDKFPYPVRHASGRIAVDQDPQTGQERLRFVNLRGRGTRGGPNENCSVEINGEMGPFTPAMSVRVTVKGENISSEPALNDAFPTNTRQALKLFDAEGKGEFPKFHGSFVCEIVRFPEVKSRWSIVTDIKLQDASGSLVAFPYPMSNVNGEIRVMDDHLEIQSVTMKRGDARLDVSGRVDWRMPASGSEDPRAPVARSGSTLRPSLTLKATNVPIDEQLLKALPERERTWLAKLRAAGKFDLDGTISRKNHAAGGDDLDFHLNVTLRQCAFGGGPVLSGVDGELLLAPQKLEIRNLAGKRGQAIVRAGGAIRWPGSPPVADVVVQATNLQLDQPLYDMLPAQARRGWDQVQPEGTVDAKIAYRGRLAPATAPTTSPTTVPEQPTYEVTIIPRELNATPTAAPYRLEGIAGAAVITPDKVTLEKITARHGDAHVRISGTGVLGAGGAWSFSQLSGDHMLVDDDLRRAVPDVLRSLLQSSQMRGQIAFDFSKLSIAPSTASPPPAPGVTTRPTEPPLDITFDVKLWAQDALLNVGVQLSKVRGSAQISGETRAGRLTALAGWFDAPTMMIADRPATNFHADIAKRPDSQAMTLYNMQANVAGGALAGQVDWISPDNAPARYAMSIILRNADMRELTGDPTPELRGQASASLALEGTWDDTGSRRGGGDVTVVGQQMYKIPLVLGLLQVTNLALPSTSPFSEANCRYSIDGDRVTFESIELGSKDMLMKGGGHLDFATRKVRLDFRTEPLNWPKIPMIGDLLQGARDELLTIHVRGTLQDPKVSASAMNTVTTTVDEVFKGNAPPEDAPTKHKK